MTTISSPPTIQFSHSPLLPFLRHLELLPFPSLSSYPPLISSPTVSPSVSLQITPSLPTRVSRLHQNVPPKGGGFFIQQWFSSTSVQSLYALMVKGTGEKGREQESSKQKGQVRRDRYSARNAVKGKVLEGKGMIVYVTGRKGDWERKEERVRHSSKTFWQKKEDWKEKECTKWKRKGVEKSFELKKVTKDNLKARKKKKGKGREEKEGKGEKNGLGRLWNKSNVKK